MTDFGLRALSAFGFLLMIAIAWLFSLDRSRFPVRAVLWGAGLQLGLAVLALKTGPGRQLFILINAVVARFLAYTEAGTDFVFGSLAPSAGEFSFIVNVLPIIIFMGSFFAVLYHLGLVQRLVDAMSWTLSRSMRLSGAESLAAVANIFVGMTEAALVVRPYLERMTCSELFSLMNVGMATVAGSILLAYVGLLGGGDYAGHLVIASLLSAPAGLLIAKIIVPENETPQTISAGAAIESDSVNIIDAAARGALDGLRLAAYVGSLLIAFVALIALLNDVLGGIGGWIGLPGLSFQQLLGYLLAPLAFAMGVPWQDAPAVGSLLGVKTVLNEFIAYQQLAGYIGTQGISQRSAVIASYALCGFANFGSLAILLGGIGGMAPTRRPEVARLGLRSILGGSLSTFMTGCVAGMIL